MARQSSEWFVDNLARADERCARHRDDDFVATKMFMNDLTKCNYGGIGADCN